MREEYIKLVWEFRGLNHLQTAKHHVRHLQEFLMNLDKNYPTSVEGTNENYSKAILIVPKSEMIFFRDTLKPHYGELVEEI